MIKVGIIVGSTRPGRKAAAVAAWVHNLLKSRNDAEFEIVDIEDFKLPLLDEPAPPHHASVRQSPYEELERENCLARRLHFRHPRIQPCDLGGTKERHRFPLSRME